MSHSRINPVEVIARKRDGKPLSAEEIGAVIQLFAMGELPDYQMSALAMAILLRGMDTDETLALTRAMLDSGRRMHGQIDGIPRVDKHSTGGIGDKVSLILAPLLACCGLQVPMISGRGLGPTGGTLDKLEAIPGFRTDLSLHETQAVVNDIGCVITGASLEIAPADRKLYALRDVTGTVPSIPLITASIMSKKLAEGLDALVLDVKVGSGAFMKTITDARALARSMVEVGHQLGTQTTALITDMNQPLGRMVGNTLEVIESIEVLQGGGPDDVIEITLALGAELLVAAETVDTIAAALLKLRRQLANGSAYERFEQMVAAQGGRLSELTAPAPAVEWCADRDGYVEYVDLESLGWAVIALGGGRKQTEDAIDHSVGLECLLRTGDMVSRGQPIVRIHMPPGEATRIESHLRRAIAIRDEAPEPGPLVIERLVTQ